MDERLRHINQWKHNRRFLTSITPEFPDWAVTCAFYISLHAVDALLAYDGVTGVTSHDSRKRVLINTNRYRYIRERFIPLFDLSRTVRYLADPTSWVKASDIEANVLKRYLYPIESSVQKLIGDDLGLPEVKLSGLWIAESGSA